MIHVYRPDTLRDLLALLAAAEGPRYCLAGGTELVARQQAGLIGDSLWADIGAIPDFRGIRKDGEDLWIGAATTHSEVVESPLLGGFAPALVEACAAIGSPQVRNQGTIGGNVACGSADADAVCALLTLDAEVELAARRERRRLPLADFATGPEITVRRPEEVVLGVRFPARKHLRGAYRRVAPRNGATRAKAAVAVSAVLREGEIEHVRVALGGVGPRVLRALGTEKRLLRDPWSAATLARAMETAVAEARPLDDLRSSADYRRRMCGILLKRALDGIGLPLE
ncbi:MAG: FAD binding domain-containing protein [Planctomycetes bacterium]|nr:FAD binding domain-containing protein [Planctomycetota bacterium]